MLTEGELELLRQWIRGGAPETGIVKDAAAGLGCDASDAAASPNKIPPLPSPELDVAVARRSCEWELFHENLNFDASSKSPCLISTRVRNRLIRPSVRIASAS